MKKPSDSFTIGGNILFISFHFSIRYSHNLADCDVSDVLVSELDGFIFLICYSPFRDDVIFDVNDWSLLYIRHYDGVISERRISPKIKLRTPILTQKNQFPR